MFRHGFLGVLAAAFCVAGCGGGSPKPEEPLAAGGSGSLGSGGLAGSVAPPSGGSSGRPPPSVYYASFVAETQPGEGPALVFFKNDTKFIMSLWLAQSAFIAVPSGSTAGPKLAASAAIVADTTTGQHKENACVVFPIAKIDGPKELEPGLSYSMSIALDAALGFVGTLSEAPAVPFVAVRAEVLDRTSNAFKPSRLAFTPQGLRDTQALRFITYDKSPTPYKYAGPGKFSASISFVAGNGDSFAGSEPVTLTGRAGFTVVVDDVPVDRAAAVVPLNKANE